MKVKSFSLAILMVCTFSVKSIFAQEKMGNFPKFEFDVWASPPSSKVYELTSDRLVQKILYSIKESPFESDKIAAIVKEPKSLVLGKLKELEQYDLATMEKENWISNILLFVEEEIRESEKIGLIYAAKEAEILRKEIPSLKEFYGKTTLSKYFSWNEVSLIIVGAFLADLCVVDRIPFKPDNFNEELQLPLKGSSGRRWGCYGFEKLPKRFPSRKWRFYQNVSSSRSPGGMARFGYLAPNENRKSPPPSPEDWPLANEGQILFALAEGPLNLDELEARTRLKNELVVKELEKMTNYNPPSVILKNGKYWAKIPILSKSDFSLLLPELDRIAEDIFKKVILPHLEERKEKSTELGYRWPLPAGQYVRDKALQILIEEGSLSSPPPPPVNWNFGVWGWKGFLRMHDEITKDVQPDTFLTTPVSSEERRVIERFNSIKLKVLEGRHFIDTSTPAKALLTMISGFVNSEVKALETVQFPSDNINESFLEDPRNKAITEYLKQTNIRRVRLHDKKPNDGDVTPIFTVVGEQESRVTIVFFHYKGSWKFLLNTPKEGLWHTNVETVLQEKLSHLENK